MKGMFFGWLIGALATVAVIVILGGLGLWDSIDPWLGLLVGFGIGTLLSNLGMVIGVLLDDSY